jgi:hypothetical protein
MPLITEKNLFVYTEKKDSNRRGPIALHPALGQIEVEIIE